MLDCWADFCGFRCTPTLYVSFVSMVLLLANFFVSLLLRLALIRTGREIGFAR